MDLIEKIIRENCWKFDKGYPDSQEDINYLKTLIEQEIETEEVDSIVPGDKSGEQQEKVVDVIKDYTSEDIIALFKSLELDQEQLNKLFNRVNNFKSYRPIRQEVDKAGWNEKIRKKFAKEIQDLIEDLSPEDKQKFIDYLNSDKIDFLDVVPEDGVGKLADTLASTGVPLDIVSKIISHTSQDEGKRGVGMGEVGMSLLFKNVGSSTSGKGDLSIDGEEFEIKGEGATLGEKPAGFPIDMDKLEPFGLTRNAKGYQVGDKTITRNNQFAFALAEAYKQTEDKKGFKEAVRDSLTNDVGLGIGVNALFNDIDFTDPSSIQTNIALMNFVRYADKEGFNHFLAHDFGSKGPNTGEYIYVKGSPEDMAKQLKQAGAKFEKLAYNNLRPRIGFGSTKIQEDV